MKSKKLPKQSLLIEILRYDETSGILYWKPRSPLFFKTCRTSAADKARSWNNQFQDKQAINSISSTGYLKGALMGQHVLAHRVIWKMITGLDPDQIDHIDGDRTNNRFNNLRSVSSSENQRNRCLPVTNKSGHIGVCWSKDLGKWLAYARGDDSKIIHLGYFINKIDAIEARKSVNKSLHYHENHGRRDNVLLPALGGL